MNHKTKITLTIIVVCGLLTVMGLIISINFNPAGQPNPSTNWPEEVD